MKVREAAVQGRFYPHSASRITRQIRDIDVSGKYPVPEFSFQEVLGAILPHAGHMFSGYQTIPVFKFIKKHNLYPETFVIIHPNHTGRGLPVAIDESTHWKNALGTVPLDLEFAEALQLPFNSDSHALEHSAEVIIPFAQYYLANRPFSIVPVCMFDQHYENAKMLGEALYAAARETKHKILVLASSDFSHFVTPEEGKRKDQRVVDAILNKTPGEIEPIVKSERITICGYGPIMTLLDYAGRINPDYRLKMVARGHSGEIVPSGEVVDYISMLIYTESSDLYRE